MKVEKILFPTDFSEGSYHALPIAADLTRHYSAQLCILHVVYDVFKATDSHVPHVSADDLYREICDWAQKEIDTCCVEETRGITAIEKKVLKGVPHEEIIRFAADEHVDMIIMGTYGKKGLERLIFGSTAERVVRGATCPVMTVRVPAHRK